MNAYYASILLKHDAPRDDVLDALVQDDMTTEWPILYKEFYEHHYPPIPGSDMFLGQQYYEPDPIDRYVAPTSLYRTWLMAAEFQAAAHELISRILKWKPVLEKHFGSAIPSGSLQKYPVCFQGCLYQLYRELSRRHNENGENTRSKIKASLEEHLIECEKAARSVVRRVVDAFQMLKRLRGRYQDIRYWAVKGFKFGDVAPGRLRLILVESNEWLRVVIGAFRGFDNAWRLAKINHPIQEGELSDAELETLKEIWQTRADWYFQKSIKCPQELAPLDEEEMKLLSLRQQMDEMWKNRDDSSS